MISCGGTESSARRSVNGSERGVGRANLNGAGLIENTILPYD